jgi:hypothetical protein
MTLGVALVLVLSALQGCGGGSRGGGGSGGDAGAAGIDGAGGAGTIGGGEGGAGVQWRCVVNARGCVCSASASLPGTGCGDTYSCCIERLEMGVRVCSCTNEAAGANCAQAATIVDGTVASACPPS